MIPPILHFNRTGQEPIILTPGEISELLMEFSGDRHLDNFYENLGRLNARIPYSIGSRIVSIHQNVSELDLQDGCCSISFYKCLSVLFDEIHENNEGTVRQHLVVKPKLAARVESIHSIEGAEKVRLAKVDIGRAALQDIVFGDLSLEPGELVVMAPRGAQVLREDKQGRIEKLRSGSYNFITAEGEKIRQRSDALLCSPLEAGLRDDYLSCNYVARLSPEEYSLGKPVRTPYIIS